MRIVTSWRTMQIPPSLLKRAYALRCGKNQQLSWTVKNKLVVWKRSWMLHWGRGENNTKHVHWSKGFVKNWRTHPCGRESFQIFSWPGDNYNRCCGSAHNYTAISTISAHWGEITRFRKCWLVNNVPSTLTYNLWRPFINSVTLDTCGHIYHMHHLVALDFSPIFFWCHVEFFFLLLYMFLFSVFWSESFLILPLGRLRSKVFSS